MVWLKLIASLLGIVIAGFVSVIICAIAKTSALTMAIALAVVLSVLFVWWYKAFFGKGKPLHKYRKARKKDEDFNAFSKYNPIENRFRLTGTNWENRNQYIIEHKEEIENDGISLSREHSLDKDKNAIAFVHKDKVLGFIPAEYAAIIAPFIDAHREDIRFSYSIWIGRKGEMMGFFIRFSVLKHATKDEFKEIIEACKELAYTE